MGPREDCFREQVLAYDRKIGDLHMEHGLSMEFFDNDSDSDQELCLQTRFSC
jgi:hypothetical protein